LEELAQLAFPYAETSAREFLQSLEPRVELRAEEGSKKLWVRFLAASAILGIYGGVRSSLDYMVRDGKNAAAFVNKQVRTRLQLPPRSIVRQERRTGVPGKLRRLFRRVADGGLTVEQATHNAVDMLLEAGLDSQIVAGFAGDLRRELSEQAGDGLKQVPRRSEIPRLPPREHPMPGAATRGVFVWRDPKTGELELRTY
jgi:hypothetical protein